ncbi:MAG TPA: hypothetical protein VJB14_04995 [Planctomycetota bacterium]|nr:hypothetical protein [Planctomycetota bacterium]
MTRKVRVAWWIVGGLLLGSFSAWVSIRSCETKTARWLAYDVRPSPRFYVPDATEWTVKIWKLTGSDFVPYDTSTGREEKFPWRVYKPGEVILPFLARVEYGWMQEGEVGGGGHVWFLGFFGLSIRIATTTSWQS